MLSLLGKKGASCFFLKLVVLTYINSPNNMLEAIVILNEFILFFIIKINKITMVKSS